MEPLQPRENESFRNFLSRKEENLVVENVLKDDLSLKPDIEPETWGEIEQKVYAPDPWRIESLIPKEGFVILASVSGERKSWLSLEMARCISTGADFLGKFRTKECNVLYINAENSWSEIQRRGRQLGFSEDMTLHIVNADDINLQKKSWQTWLEATIEYFGIEVVFIDTFRAVAGALKEDKAEEVRQFFSALQKLKNRGVAMIFLDHTRKPSNLDGKVPKKEHLLGSQDKTASVEVLLMLKSEAGSEEIFVYQRKNRIAQEIKPFLVHMRDSEESGMRKTALTYAGELEEQENKKEEAMELVLGILENGPKTTNEILELTKKQVGSKNTRAGLAELVKQGLIDTGRQHRQNLYFLPQKDEATPPQEGTSATEELDW